MKLKHIKSAIEHENEMVVTVFVVKYDAFYKIDNKTYYIYQHEFFSGQSEREELLRTKNVWEFLLRMEEIAPFEDWKRSPGWGETEEDVLREELAG